MKDVRLANSTKETWEGQDEGARGRALPVIWWENGLSEAAVYTLVYTNCHKGAKSKCGVKERAGVARFTLGRWERDLIIGLVIGMDKESVSFLNILTVELWTVPTLEQSKGCKENSLIL